MINNNDGGVIILSETKSVIMASINEVWGSIETAWDEGMDSNDWQVTA